MWPDQSSNSLPHLRSVVDRLASNLMIYICGSNAEICGVFSDLNGIGLSLNKIVKAKIIVHVFFYLFIYLLLLNRNVQNIMLGIDN